MGCRRTILKHRQLLTDEERRQLLGVSNDPDSLARHYTFTRTDQDLVSRRRGAANRLGFAVQLALLRYPGCALQNMDESSVETLVAWLATHLDLPATAFAEYARRSQTMTDHARILAADLGMRPAVSADIPFMIEAAAQHAWSTDCGQPIVASKIMDLLASKIILPAPAVIERAAIAGRARARKRVTDAILAGISHEQMMKIDKLLTIDSSIGMSRFGWLKNYPVSPKADNMEDLVARLQVVRDIGLVPESVSKIHKDRFRQLVREADISEARQLERHATHRRRAIQAALLLALEPRLTDAMLDMADKLIGRMFTRAKNTQEKRCVASSKDVGRLMRLFGATITALSVAKESDRDGFTVVDEAVGWAKLLKARSEIDALADIAEADPLVCAADRYMTLRRFAPLLIEALAFKATDNNDPVLAALKLLHDLNSAGKRDVPANAPMPFRKNWKKLVLQDGNPNRRLYETAVLATLRDKLRSGDVWVERSSSYCQFDSYLLPQESVPEFTNILNLPATADEWLANRGQELDQRLKQFAGNLQQGSLDGVELRDGKLHIAAITATSPAQALAFSRNLNGMLPRARITEILHEVNRATGFAAAFTNLRTGENCDNENALLATTILADATNLGLTRMAAASQGVTRDELIWTANAYIRPETYQAALAKIIDAHHLLPIAILWGDGSTSSSDGQFFRSGKRGRHAGDVNARHGLTPGLCFYTHVSDQYGPYNIRVISATDHEAPFVLDGLMHHGSQLKFNTHYTDTGGVSDHVFILCRMLGFRFCPRLRDFPDRRLASIEPIALYGDLMQPIFGRRIRTDVPRKHWNEIIRLVASLQAGIVAPSVMIKKLAAYQRQNQLDLALQELGRIERTLFMLDWLENPDLRRHCHAGLNKGEQRHALAQAICTFNQGRIAERNAEMQQFRASGLNLVIAAIVYWNSTYLQDAIAHLRAVGNVPAEFLPHTSPLIPTALIFDLCPFACSDGSDNVRAAHQRIPCVGACVDDGLVCVPHLMSEEICTQIFPDVFG
jgi:TnpA family transposase